MTFELPSRETIAQWENIAGQYYREWTATDGDRLCDAIASIPDMVAEIQRLRALNAVMVAALQAITDLCKTEPANPFLADNMDRIASAILAEVAP